MAGLMGYLTSCVLAVLVVTPHALRKRKSITDSPAHRQEAPGARAQLSQKALDYFGQDLLPILVDEELPKISIPDLGGVDSGFRWTVKNVRITNPRVERPAFRFAQGKGLYLELNDIKLDLRVSYYAEGDSWWNPLFTGGDATCSPSASASGIAVLGTSNGKPTLHLSQPSVQISMGSIDIHGSWFGWLVELLTPIFRDDIEKLVESELTKVIQDVVNNDISDILARLELKVGVPVPPPFDDSGLYFNLTSISTYSEHVAVDLSVAIIDPRDPTRVVQQPVNTTIPDAVRVDKMLSVSLAPEVIEDIVHFHQDKWSHTLQKDDIPSESPLGLDSGSLTLLTTPPLSTLWGQKDMQLTVSLGGLAEVHFGEGVVDIKAPSLFKFDLKHDGAEPEHAFTLEAPVDAIATVKFEAEPEQTFHAELESMSLTPLSTKEMNSRIWFVNTFAISPLIELLEESVIMPEINKLLRPGVACCDVDGFGGLQGASLRISAGVISLFTDIDLDLRSILR